MSISRFLFRAGTIFTVLMMTLSSAGPAAAAPANDNFADATAMALPYSASVDVTGATTETGEPFPTCSEWPAGAFAVNSVWLKYTAAADGTLRASLLGDNEPVLAVYTAATSSPSVGSLTQIACISRYDAISVFFPVQKDVTYYVQLESMKGLDGLIPFTLVAAPPVQAGFNYDPPDPSLYDTVAFTNTSIDPFYNGFKSYAWDFGDGTTAATEDVTHQYAKDGAYTVNMEATTTDGRKGSISHTVTVITRDVSITRLSVPKTGRVGRSAAITVRVINKRYAGNVQVELVKVTSLGTVSVGLLTLNVPVRTSPQTTFKFTYTFTPADAQAGTVTFQATATPLDGRDAVPSDNIASATTTVTR